MQKTRFPAVISTFIVCYAFWILLTWNFSAQELAAGAIVSLAVALFSARFFVHEHAFHFFNPVHFFSLLAYIPVFMWELLKANWDVAKRCFGDCKKKVNPWHRQGSGEPRRRLPRSHARKLHHPHPRHHYSRHHRGGRAGLLLYPLDRRVRDRP